MAILLLAGCSGSSVPLTERVVEINVGAGLDGPICKPSSIVVQPGELIRFLINNDSGMDLEFIVTNPTGVKKREETLVPQNIEVDLAIKPNQASQIEFIQVHGGHDGELGPNASKDFRYRILLEPQNFEQVISRSMVVTFPEVGEADPLTHFVCTNPDSYRLQINTILRR